MNRSNRIQGLLDKLCVELGFCLPADEHSAILAAPPGDIDGFVERVYRAEGMDLDRRAQLYAQVRDRVAAVFDTVPFMRVAWPDGSVIAEVDVAPSCDPIATTHVLGGFAPAPGFARLAPYLDAMKNLWAAGDDGAAFGVSEEMDDLGVVAIDDLGRRYVVFNLVFEEAGLLFCVTSETPSAGH